MIINFSYKAAAFTIFFCDNVDYSSIQKVIERIHHELLLKHVEPF
jgi:hypothetical protein